MARSLWEWRDRHWTHGGTALICSPPRSGSDLLINSHRCWVKNMHDPIARTAARLLRRGGLTPAGKRRARARIRAKAKAAKRGGYGGGFEQAVNWRGLRVIARPPLVVMPNIGRLARLRLRTGRASCRRSCLVSKGRANILEKADFQKGPRRATSVLVTIPWGFVNDLRRSGYLSEQNSHNKEKIGRAVVRGRRHLW
jgi:hypothetical protein